MTTQQTLPSIDESNSQKRLQQFKTLFNNSNDLNNSTINYHTPRQQRKNESVEIIIDHTPYNRSISTWLEISDDDNNDNEYTNNDINDDNEISNECDTEQMEISATLTLSPSYGDTTATYNTILPLQQSVTSPLKPAKPFTFEQDNNNNNNKSTDSSTNDAKSKQIEKVNNVNNKQKVKKQSIIREWKPVINEIKDEHKANDSLLMLQNKKLVNGLLDNKGKMSEDKVYKRGPTESLILLQNKKIVNNQLKCYVFEDGIKEDGDDEFEVCDDPENRPLPVWLDNSEKMDGNDDDIVDEVEGNLSVKHTKELTDVLD